MSSSITRVYPGPDGFVVTFDRDDGAVESLEVMSNSFAGWIGINLESLSSLDREALEAFTAQEVRLLKEQERAEETMESEEFKAAAQAFRRGE